MIKIYNINRLRTDITVFLIGAFFYGVIEILWRGYTHPAMLLLGGICLSFIYFAELYLAKKYSVVVRGFLYSAIITLLEFACGLVVNVALKLEVWNYSDLPYNYMGQICLAFSLLWFVLALICCFLCRVLRYAFR